MGYIKPANCKGERVELLVRASQTAKLKANKYLCPTTNSLITGLICSMVRIRRIYQDRKGLHSG